MGTVMGDEPVELGEHLDSMILSASIVDHDDGTVSFEFPPEWFHKSGRYFYRIFGKKAFCLEDDYYTRVPCGEIVTKGTTNATCECPFQLVSLMDTFLWHVDLHPIECKDPLASTDPTGIACQCSPGAAPTLGQPCAKGDRTCACTECSVYGRRWYSPDGVECNECRVGEEADAVGAHCQCEKGRYNATDGPGPPGAVKRP
jgi:hypothetical protein